MSNLMSVRRNLKVRSECSSIKEKFPFLLFDRRRLQQVLINLLSNAQKFQTDGEIVVTADIVYRSTEDEEYLLRVGVKD